MLFSYSRRKCTRFSPSPLNGREERKNASHRAGRGERQLPPSFIWYIRFLGRYGAAQCRRCAPEGVHRGGRLYARERIAQCLPCADFFGYFLVRKQESNVPPSFEKSPIVQHMPLGMLYGEIATGASALAMTWFSCPVAFSGRQPPGADALLALPYSHPLRTDGRKSGTFSPGVLKYPVQGGFLTLPAFCSVFRILR